MSSLFSLGIKISIITSFVMAVGCTGDGVSVEDSVVKETVEMNTDEETGNEPVNPTACQSVEDVKMLQLVNAARSQSQDCGVNGVRSAVGALVWDCKLATAALNHSQDMASNNFFDHTGTGNTSPGDRIDNVGYSWSSYGENIAAGQTTVESVVAGWLDSDGHCSNIMGSSFIEFGSAKVEESNSRYKIYWTQNFARPR